MVPTEALPPGIVSTAHVTVVVVVPVTEAVNVWASPVVSPTRTGLMVTEIPPVTAVVTVMVAEAVLVVSVTDLAVAVTLAGVGTLAGAV